MAEIVQSLFGVTPEMYQQSQQARADQQAMQYARLSPFEQANYAIGRGANMLGGAVARGLGGEDPELARITMRQQIAGQINFANPKSIFQGVELLRQANDSQGAMMLADAGRKAESERALAQQRTAEKMTPEERNAAAYAKSIAEPGTPQYNRIYQTTLQGLISKEKPDLTTPDQKNARDFALRAGPEGSLAFNEAYIAKLEQFTTKPESRPLIREIGIAKGTEEAVYTYQQGNNPPQQVVYRTVDGQQQIVPYSGPVDRTTAKTQNITKLPEGEAEFTKELGKLDAKAVAKASENRGVAIEQLETLRKMAEVADRPVIVAGSLTDAAV
jgi:hypothetical protein